MLPSRGIGVAMYDALSYLETGGVPGIAQLVQERTQVLELHCVCGVAYFCLSVPVLLTLPTIFFTQGIAMLSYLTTIINTQVQLAERLNNPQKFLLLLCL